MMPIKKLGFWHRMFLHLVYTAVFAIFMFLCMAAVAGIAWLGVYSVELIT